MLVSLTRWKTHRVEALAVAASLSGVVVAQTRELARRVTVTLAGAASRSVAIMWMPMASLTRWQRHRVKALAGAVSRLEMTVRMPEASITRWKVHRVEALARAVSRKVWMVAYPPGLEFARTEKDLFGSAVATAQGRRSLLGRAPLGGCLR